MSHALAIFAKAPIAGQVKTRLCPPLTLAEAAALYHCFLSDLIARMSTLADVDLVLAVTPAHSTWWFRTVWPAPIHCLSQRGHSLGEREAHVFCDLLQQGYQQVVLIGSDIPTLPVSHVHDAFALLAEPTNDVVLSRSHDGGYYLLGARQLHPSLFENIPWSTSTVFADTVAHAHQAGLTVAQVPAWYDVDTVAALQQLVEELTPAAHAGRAPQTRALLTRLGWLTD